MGFDTESIKKIQEQLFFKISRRTFARFGSDEMYDVAKNLRRSNTKARA